MKQSLKTLIAISCTSILLLAFQNCGEGFDAAQLESLKGMDTTYHLNSISGEGGHGFEGSTTNQGYRLVVTTNSSNQEILQVKDPQGRTLAQKSSTWIINLTKKFEYKVVRDPYKPEVKFVFLNTNRNPARVYQFTYDGGFRHISSSEESEIILGNLNFDYGKDLINNANTNDLQGLKVHRHDTVETLFVGKNRIRKKDIKVLGGADVVTFACSRAGGDCAETCASDERLARDGACKGLVISCSNGEGTKTWNPQINKYGACIVPETPSDTNDDATAPQVGDACVLSPGYDNVPPTMGVLALYEGRLICTYTYPDYHEGGGGQ